MCKPHSLACLCVGSPFALACRGYQVQRPPIPSVLGFNPKFTVGSTPYIMWTKSKLHSDKPTYPLLHAGHIKCIIPIERK